MNTRLPMNHKLITLILVGISAAFMGACGGGNNNSGISIGFSEAPPAVLQTSTVTPLNAVVVNDNSTAGVDWTVTCGGSDCGSFSPAHTASGVSTNYTAPATIPSGNTVTITATATANTSAVATGTVTITTGSTGSALNGQYSFLISGADPSGNYVAAGSVIADGNGNITNGERGFVRSPRLRLRCIGRDLCHRSRRAGIHQCLEYKPWAADTPNCCHVELSRARR